jgi:hypothetical protein
MLVNGCFLPHFTHSPSGRPPFRLTDGSLQMNGSIRQIESTLGVVFAEDWFDGPNW